MTKRISIPAIALIIASCASNADKPIQPTCDKETVIFETDMGNDVDDALALTILHNYVDQDRIDLAAVMLNKHGQAPVEYVDIINTYYGHPDIPIASTRKEVICGNEESNYAKTVTEMTSADGSTLFSRSIADYNSLPTATELYRRILANSPDSSVTIISVGFSSNLADLLESEADTISSLTGRELVTQKVKLLSVMAGSVLENANPEYNVAMNIPAAQSALTTWPGKIILSPFEVGESILYPATVIENDSLWPSTPNPVVEGYKSYIPMPYDRPTWDLTSVIAAVEGTDMFSVSNESTLSIDDQGHTHFTDSIGGARYYLSVDSAQSAEILKHLIDLTTFSPKQVEINK